MFYICWDSVCNYTCNFFACFLIEFFLAFIPCWLLCLCLFLSLLITVYFFFFFFTMNMTSMACLHLYIYIYIYMYKRQEIGSIILTFFFTIYIYIYILFICFIIIIILREPYKMIKANTSELAVGSALTSRVFFSNVSNLASFKKGGRTGLDSCKTLNTALTERENAHFGEFGPQALPTTPPFASEGVSCVVKRVGNEESPVFSPYKTQTQDTCEKNCLFMGDINILPATPECKIKKDATSAPFRRSLATVEFMATTPPPRKKSGDAEAPPLFVRFKYFDSTKSSTLLSGDVLPRKARKENYSGNSEDNVDENLPPKTAATQTIKTFMRLPLKHNSGDVSKERIGNLWSVLIPKDKEGCSVCAEDVTMQKIQAEKMKDFSYSRFASRESICSTTCLDKSDKAPLCECDVLVTLREPTASLCPPALSLDGCYNPTTPDKKMTTDNTTCVKEKGFLRQIFTSAEKESNVVKKTTAESFCHATVVFAVNNGISADYLCGALSQRLSDLSIELFKEHHAQLLNAAFVVGYTKIVAFPTLRMLEFYGRRIICMQRDIGIRNLIELFCAVFLHQQRPKCSKKKHQNFCFEKAQRFLPWKNDLRTHSLFSRRYLCYKKESLDKGKKYSTLLPKIGATLMDHSQNVGRGDSNFVLSTPRKHKLPKNFKGETKFANIAIVQLN